MKSSKDIEIGLSDDQKEALHKIYTWLDREYKEFCLSGSAGTGKTYLVRRIISDLEEEREGMKICVSAPTHKALNNISNILKTKSKTLHSLLALRPNVNLESFSLDNVIFDSSGTPEIGLYNLVIIDECSMISESLHKIIKNSIKDKEIKVLYLGDGNQLPPVSNRNKNELSSTFNVECKHKLTTIMRQEKGHPLLEMFALLRYDVETNSRTFLNHIKTNRENYNTLGGYKMYNNKGFISTSLKVFKRPQFLTDSSYIRGACYTNKCISERNIEVRNELLNVPYDVILTKGELLTSYTNIWDDKNRGYILKNSEDYIVKMVSKQMLDLRFQIYCITIENTSNGDTRFFNVVDHTHELFGNWLHLANVLYDKAVNSSSKDRKQSWFKWFTFQKKFITIVDVPLYNGHIFHKSLDYGYFLSVHKLQGSTIRNICIDMSDIYYPISRKGLELKNDLNTANRLMYVALSRATKYAIIKF